MLWTIAVILFVPWLLGLVTSHTLGGLIHLLLVVALIVLVRRLRTSRASPRPSEGVRAHTRLPG